MKWPALFFFLLMHGIAQAQLCGQGVFRLQFYVLNGQQIKQIQYEVVPAPPHFIDNILLERDITLKDREHLFYRKIEYGIIVSEAEVEKQLSRKTEISSEEQKKLQDLISGQSRRSGNAAIEFITHENYYHPVLIRLTLDNRKYYLAGNFFGGCNRTRTLLWEKVYGLQYTEINE